MKIADLAAHGFPPYFLETWARQGLEELFPSQAQVVENSQLFSSQNLIISAPTASGKTFLAELAAIKTILSNRRVIYLAPLRSLAEEKYQEFRQKYQEYGLKVLLSSGEKCENDREIGQGKFDLAVIVYEKMLSFLTTRPALLNLLGLVIVDELQNLGQDQRGILLEYLICLLRQYPACRIIGLTAVISEADALIPWLRAQYYHSAQRPQELREGVLVERVFHYREFNSGLVGEEILTDNQGETEVWANALRLANRGEQSLVFLPDRQSTRFQAFNLAQQSCLPAASGAIAELSLLEQTTSTLQLLVTLRQGIAFHNAELTNAERQIVEKYFKNGQIKLIFATTTLAMGVNLPAQNVFIDPHIWRYDDFCQRPYLDIISRAEKENEAGRAGRFAAKIPGRMIIKAASPKEFDTYWRTYIERIFPPSHTCLTPEKIAPLVLWLVCGPRRHIGQLESFFQGTFAHFLAARQKQPPDWRSSIEKTLKSLAAAKLIFVNSQGKITPSLLARIAAAKGISANTALQLYHWLGANLEGQPSELEILLAVALTENGADIYLSGENQHLLREKYWPYLEEHLATERLDELGEIMGHDTSTYKYLREVKMAVTLHLWLSPESTLNVEQKTNCLAGEIAHLAEHFAWIIGSAAQIAKDLYRQHHLHKKLLLLQERLRYGVDEAALELARLRLPGLGRENCQRLAREGLDSLDALREIGPERLGQIIGPELAARILAASPTTVPPAVKFQLPQSQDVIEITNHYQGRHYFINVNGQEVKLTRRLFGIILRLALEKQHGAGWVHKLDEAINDESLSLITKLRSCLKSYLRSDPKTIIASDQYGSLRLDLPPQNLLIDVVAFQNHPHDAIKSIVK